MAILQYISSVLQYCNTLYLGIAVYRYPGYRYQVLNSMLQYSSVHVYYMLCMCTGHQVTRYTCSTRVLLEYVLAYSSTGIAIWTIDQIMHVCYDIAIPSGIDLHG